ncbi:hypothetical protein [Ectobacillus ponti]|uniref:Uncharacterized protein n=1 Tax=Ectobacillus ponti TaxID=2961894 RepID=A0AA41XAG9_9BACI|nr:hypothetical protein [Ectobacillus ponti]MCP8968446.1 hypothetical protein [Ectobacillus ponti]
MVDKKKYWTLLLPTFVICAVLLYYLPKGDKQDILLVPFVFWMMYYAWCYLEEHRKKH